MKKIVLLFIFFVATQVFAQTKGITYQAVIFNPKGEQLPGVNNSNSPLVNKNICMVFKFVDEFSNVEYQETIQTQTDAFGMVNLLIGSGTQTAGYAASFKDIVWNTSKKSLIVGINTEGNCATYVEISNQDFSYVPLAFNAVTADNVTGVVAIENGGTNATTLLGARTNLGINNVDNTSDLNKPISNATQAALNLKENLINKSTDIAADANSDIKYPSVKSVKIYVDGKLLVLSNNLDSEINRAKAAETANSNAIAAEVTRATAAEGVNATAIDTEKTRAIAAETVNSNAIVAEVTRATAAEGVNATAIITEKNRAIAAETTNANAIAAEVTRATAAEGVNATAIDTEKTRAIAAETTNANAIAAEVTRATAAEGVNATAIDTEKTRAIAAETTNANAIAAEVIRATAAETTNATAIANETANRIAADLLKAPLASPTFTGTVSGITSAMVGLGNVDNTTDANKPVSNATQTALNGKEATITAGTTSQYFRGDKTWATLDKTAVGLNNVDNTTDANKPVSNATQTALDLKAALASPALTGTPTAPTATAGTNTTQIATTEFVTTAIASATIPDATSTVKGKIQLSGDLSGTAAAPTITNDAVTSSKILDGTIVNADISATAAIAYSKLSLTNSIQNSDLLANSITTSKVANGTVTNSKMADDAITSIKILDGTITNADISTTAAIAYSKLNLTGSVALTDLSATATASATTYLRGDNTWASLNKTSVGLSNVDNTTDANKPVSTATQTALDLKAALASPALTGTPTAPTATTGTNTTQIATTAFVASAVTNATTGSFVDLTTAQTIAGTKTFSSDIISSGVRIGKGKFKSLADVAVGEEALMNTTGGGNNTAIGYASSANMTTATNSVSVGYESMRYISSANSNTAVGSGALFYSNADNNTALGHEAGKAVSTGGNNTFLGAKSDANSSTLINATAIGYNAVVTANNTVQLGNTSVTDVKTSGAVTASGFKTSSGTSSQFLKADGSVDATSYAALASPALTGTPTAPTAAVGTNNNQVATTAFVASTISNIRVDVVDEFLATASQTSFTLTQKPSPYTKVKMYINGIRISRSAYYWSTDKTLTYYPTYNGGYNLTADDRIQFDYFTDENVLLPD